MQGHPLPWRRSIVGVEGGRGSVALGRRQRAGVVVEGEPSSLD
jgi:hypothetical protein